MKSVLISIQPKWCEQIANGGKTIEVRKTRPKIETPFKCYIYCTKQFYRKGDGYFQGKYCGKVIGEFVCDRIEDMRDVQREPTCLTIDEWLKYTDGHKGIVWGWHISDLVIYEKPKELSEFATLCLAECSAPYKCDKCEYYYREDYEDGVYEECCCNNLKPLKRPPQSWCYVEGVEGK